MIQPKMIRKIMKKQKYSDALNFATGCVSALVMTGLLCGCNKSDDPGNFKPAGIIAGNTDSAVVFQIADTVGTLYGNAEYVLDVNNDNVNDLIFKTHVSWYFGGMMGFYSSAVQAVNNTEILTDTIKGQVIRYDYKELSGSTFVTDTIRYLNREIIPKPVARNSAIDNTGDWNTDSTLFFCYSKADLLNSDPLETRTIVMKGWENAENGFLGFRIILSGDTLYGWIRLEIKNMDQVILMTGAYRGNI